ncbi:hypothetical protein DL96DRAFT_1709124 [Flagelloscypha sp. PMI_526]|nr:hypothetical protein DL96DRAFT_1709124 [Flagelloscypha sp. PMI_526]
MNNLLRTLANSHDGTDPDLKLLLATVKESRKHVLDTSKFADPFYESLEGVLSDLRMTTMDSRDAEPFMRPVARADAPDYYEVIAHPMDFQTMAKKVKAKQYKSKAEFKDDLDLIWGNCLQYNAAEQHPIRQAAQRLKAKADILVRNLTDRKERNDIPIPPELATSIKPVVNGIHLNGHSRTHSGGKPGTIVIKPGSSSQSTVGKAKAIPKAKVPQTNMLPSVDFGSTPAITRSREGMSKFIDLDQRTRQVEEQGDAVKIEGMDRFDGRPDLLSDLEEFIPRQDEGDSDQERSPSSELSEVGQKRKLHDSSPRPRKRSKTTPSIITTLAEEDDLTNRWWSAMQSDALIANGLPSIQFSRSSNHDRNRSRAKKKKRPKKEDRQQPTDKRVEEDVEMEVDPPVKADKRLLTLMNSNIKTLKRVRVTHAKFAALDAMSGLGPGEDGEGDAQASQQVMLPQPQPLPDDDPETDRLADERPWRLRGRGIRSGLTMGRENADDCLKWGATESTMDVLVGVAGDYLMKLGTTLKFLVERCKDKMTSEEIMLHALFESNVREVRVLERYVMDDIERYGSRLGDLEKKLVGAYREVTSMDMAIEEDGLFDDEGEDEDAGALAMGDFADLLGEDYLGFRELGIASEFGMSSLTIPKRLLRGRRYQQHLLQPQKSKKPPLPYPPYEPFVPLDSTSVEKQIGLLQPYYRKRLATLAVKALPPPAPSPPTIPTLPQLSAPVIPPLSGPALPGTSQPVPGPSTDPPQQAPISSAPAPAPAPAPILVLPDDAPSPSQVKMGPLGQIIKPGLGAAAKKKAAAAAANASSRNEKKKESGGNGIVAKKKGGGSSTPATTGSKSPQKPIHPPPPNAAAPALPPVIAASA